MPTRRIGGSSACDVISRVPSDLIPSLLQLSESASPPDVPKRNSASDPSKDHPYRVGTNQVFRTSCDPFKELLRVYNVNEFDLRFKSWYYLALHSQATFTGWKDRLAQR